MTKEELEKLIIEFVTDKHYADFVIMMDRLLAHPYSYVCEEFIMKYRRQLFSQQLSADIIEPEIGSDGRSYVTTYRELFLISIHLTRSVK